MAQKKFDLVQKLRAFHRPSIFQIFLMVMGLVLGILLFVFLDFGAERGQPINQALAAIVAHHARMKARPSAAA